MPHHSFPTRSPARRSLRIGAVGLLALPFAMGGCLPPTDCSSVLTSGSQTFCDGGLWTDLGGASHSTVIGSYAPAPYGALASWSFGATESTNAHAVGGVQWTVVEDDPDGSAEGFAPGTYDLDDGELSVQVASPTGTVTATGGSITITRFDMTSDPQRAGQLDHLTATVDVDTPAGTLHAAVRIH